MLFKSFSRVLVFVSLCALFAAVASKPSRMSRDMIQRRIANRAVSGTKTLKQYDARSPHTRTHDKRQASPVAGANRQANGDDSSDPTTSPSTNGQDTSSTAPAASSTTAPTLPILPISVNPGNSGSVSIGMPVGTAVAEGTGPALPVPTF